MNPKDNTSNRPAPVALFAFRRPEHTARALAALKGNEQFHATPLYVFCDGPRGPNDAREVDRVREVVGAFDHRLKHVIAADRNKGLANSVIEGVTKLCGEYGRVIVVEDDLVVAPGFLQYMNRALDQYSDSPRVMQISGYMFPVKFRSADDAAFLPFPTSWGWATWRRAWEHFDPTMAGWKTLASDRKARRRFDLNGAYPYFAMLKRQRSGKIDSWAIRWHLSCFMRNGLTLYPSSTLVRNDGYDGSGTHTGVRTWSEGEFRNGSISHLPSEIAINPHVFRDVCELLAADNTFAARALRRLARFLGRKRAG